jgi:hypothetical protein
MLTCLGLTRWLLDDDHETIMVKGGLPVRSLEVEVFTTELGNGLSISSASRC